MKTNQEILYSIVIPVYNSTKSLEQIVVRIDDVFKNMDNSDYEIIFIDDCSPNPKSWEMMKRLQEQYEKVSVIELTRNFGQQSATLCGLKESKGDYIITMDDDLQHRPEDIPKLIAKNEFDIVIGTFKKKNHSIFKRFTSKVKGYFDHLLIGKPKHIQLSSFRLFNRTLVDGMLSISTPNPFIPALMFYVSKSVTDVAVTHDPRLDGRSNYTFSKMVKMFSNLIINNSAFLLQSIGYIGILISFITFIAGIILIIKKIITPVETTGWTSVIVTILFMSGLLLFSFGIIGEYLIRIISGVEHKPTYIIREKRDAR